MKLATHEVSHIFEAHDYGPTNLSNMDSDFDKVIDGGESNICLSTPVDIGGDYVVSFENVI